MEEELGELQEHRAAKDEYFRDDPASPLPSADRRIFAGLGYYPEDSRLSFVVTPEPFPRVEEVLLQTTDGEERLYDRVGRVRFTVDEQECELTVYRDPEANQLFLPFQDATSGNETYGAGRYLELPSLGFGRFLLDFNYAYFPFCAYNPMFACPIPPAENRLRVAIRAGERNR